MAVAGNKEGQIVRIAEQLHPTPIRLPEELSHQYIEEKRFKAAALRGAQGAGVRDGKVPLEADMCAAPRKELRHPLQEPASNSPLRQDLEYGRRTGHLEGLFQIQEDH